MKNSLSVYLTTVLSLLLFSNCGKPFTTPTPEGFAPYTDNMVFKSVSPDHVVYRIRMIKNDPFADFNFWREALPERMKNAGYRVICDTILSIENSKSLLLEMAAPLGNVDYSYLVMMKVNGEQILLAEAAGIYTNFQNRKQSIIEALKKTALK
jgi:hypothetical protein